MTPVSEIKLIRTDTTLDLSQKAEKVCKEKSDQEDVQFLWSMLQGRRVHLSTIVEPQKKLKGDEMVRESWHTYLARSWELLP